MTPDPNLLAVKMKQVFLSILAKPKRAKAHHSSVVEPEQGNG